MREIEGNIVTIVNRDGGILVHQVNCIPVAGAGLAKVVARTWSTWHHDYLHRCPILGDAWLHFTKSQDKLCLAVIASIYGQRYIGRDKRQTDYDALSSGLRWLEPQTRGLRGLGHILYVPVGMGCGLAGGNWNYVRPLIERYLPDAVLVRLAR